MSNVCSAGLDVGFASLDYLQIFILGVIQGITELLPVSSTAHMRVVPALLGLQDPGSALLLPASCSMAAPAACVLVLSRALYSALSTREQGEKV